MLRELFALFRTSRTIRFGAYLLIVIGLAGYLISSAWLFFPEVFNVFTREEPAPDAAQTTGLPLGPTGPMLHESAPIRLRVPAAHIDADFSAPLGLTPEQEVEVPKEYDRVGWYQYGPTPGELGPAAVFGHVDSHQGPAVFYSLGQVKTGDSVFIDREDGSVAEFEVTALQRVPQDDFPTERVYGNIDHAGLRLITCTGTYDRGELRYTHNLIVYAQLKSTGVDN